MTANVPATSNPVPPDSQSGCWSDTRPWLTGSNGWARYTKSANDTPFWVRPRLGFMSHYENCF